MSRLKIHPNAALFPMLNADELKELAADIKEHGLRSPIVLDKDGMVVDGRNRLAACEIAKIKPEFTTLNGTDAESFIISQNLARRHLTPGQRAMVVATMYPDAEHGGARKKGSSVGPTLEQFPMVSRSSLQHARKVMRFANDLVNNVLGGAVSLEKAYMEARNREQLAESDEAKLAILRGEARDLADLVTEERMQVDEALAALQKRKQQLAEIIEHGKLAAESGLARFLADVASIIAAVKSTDETFLDKKRVNAVVKAAHQLQSLL